MGIEINPNTIQRTAAPQTNPINVAFRGTNKFERSPVCDQICFTSQTAKEPGEEELREMIARFFPTPEAAEAFLKQAMIELSEEGLKPEDEQPTLEKYQAVKSHAGKIARQIAKYNNKPSIPPVAANVTNKQYLAGTTEFLKPFRHIQDPTTRQEVWREKLPETLPRSGELLKTSVKVAGIAEAGIPEMERLIQQYQSLPAGT